jgi:hypothetical protein
MESGEQRRVSAVLHCHEARRPSVEASAIWPRKARNGTLALRRYSIKQAATFNAVWAMAASVKTKNPSLLDGQFMEAFIIQR